MGKVFSADSVEMHRVPEPGAHAAAGEFLLQQVLRNHDDYGVARLAPIKSAMVFGSTALGATTVRSDLDVLFVYNPRLAHPGLTQISDIIAQTEEKFSVPVEQQVFHSGALGRPLEHNVDPLLAEHLLHIQDDGRWSVNWPVHELRNKSEKPATDRADRVKALAVRYTSAKMRQMARGIAEFRGSADLAIMQRALELPAAIGRKVLSVTVQTPDVNQQVVDKAWAITMLRRDMEPSERLESVDQLISLDLEYSQLLSSAVSGHTSLTAYSQWLDSSYVPACQLAHSVSYYWLNRLRYTNSVGVLLPRQRSGGQHRLLDENMPDFY